MKFYISGRTSRKCENLIVLCLVVFVVCVFGLFANLTLGYSDTEFCNVCKNLVEIVSKRLKETNYPARELEISHREGSLRKILYNNS